MDRMVLDAIRCKMSHAITQMSGKGIFRRLTEGISLLTISAKSILGNYLTSIHRREAGMAHDSLDSTPADAAGFTADDSVPVPEGRRWPDRLKELSRILRNPPDRASLDEARGDAWKILNGIFSMYLRMHAARMGWIGREDREDLAAEKSLEILRRLESGKTDFGDRSPGEIAGFISKSARNELLDFLRKDSRRVETGGDEREGWDVGGVEGNPALSAADSPDVAVERLEFIGNLRRCVARLNPRSRLCWFYRVFYGMVSKNIAVHPRIRLKPGHVDVLLQRSRDAIRECMQRAGFDIREMPPGTFAELWKAFRLEGV